MDPLKGQLLLAGGGLLDLNFRQTVVLIAEHGDEGAVGVVLNRPASLTVSESAPELSRLPGIDERLFMGGPVAPENAVVLAEYERPDLADAVVFDSIGLHDLVAPAAVDPGVRRARVFAGYAGWGPGQLESELQADAWIVAAATTEDVFCPQPEELWRQVLSRLGPRYAMLRQMPFDPSSN